MERFKMMYIVGEGSFGKVYKATDNKSNATVALKLIGKRGRSAKELKGLRQECEIQRHLCHPNIIQMLESFETNNEIVVVTEFAKGDLHSLLSREGSISEHRAQKLTYGLVSALYYLHSHRILHRDLKPQNILLDNENAKLCDFGLARNMTMGTHVLTSIKGTPLYMAPELMAEKPYDHQADLWSLGCIIYEVLAGQPPFCTTNILHLLKLIRHDHVKWPSFLTDMCISFLRGLLEKDPENRMTWPEILNHSFVKNHIIILNEDIPESPFTHPMSASQTEEKLIQTKKILQINKSTYKKLNSTIVPEISKGLNDITTSHDSTHAILQSDIETIETTDTDESILSSNNRVLDYYHKTKKNNIKVPIIPEEEKILSDLMKEYCKINYVCQVFGNTNLIVNYFNDNFPLSQNVFENPILPINNITTTTTTPPTTITTTNNNKKKTLKNKIKIKSNNLEKRKLSQNLDNFSVRLGQSLEIDKNRRQQIDSNTDENIPVSQSLTTHKVIIKNLSIDKQMKSLKKIETPPNLINPEWDLSESQSPPIENEEWIAFLHRSMQEILDDDELDSLRQQNFVSIIVTPLRNLKASCKVIESVAHLLSLPLIICGSSSILTDIQKVYVEVKLVPNLVYASKLLCSPSSGPKTPSPVQISPIYDVQAMSNLTLNELHTLSSLYELVCHLVHLGDHFLSQFCDAIAVLGADKLLINFIATVSNDPIKTRLVNSVIALLCCAIRELPENAELVEKIIFNKNVKIITLLQHTDSLLRSRMCMLLRLIGRFSCHALQNNWSSVIRETIEAMSCDSNDIVRNEAELVLEEFKELSFYSQNLVV